jgi:hypothetical protein
MLRRVSFLLLAIASFGALGGCSKSGSPMSPSRVASGYGVVTLHLTDAPAMFDHVNLDVREVWVHRIDDDTPGDTLGDCDSTEHDSTDRDSIEHDSTDHDGDGDRHHGRHEHGDHGTWIQLDGTPGIIDVLALQDGVFATLGTGAVPAGSYNQIRLVLGVNNTIVVDNVSYPLEVPSEERAGFRLIGRFDVSVGGSADIGIDFDAARSIHQEGNGDWVLRPVVRIAPLGTTGRIAGQVHPESVRTWAFALQGADTIASSRTHEGRFTLALLPAGTYAIGLAPTGAYRDTTLSAVQVTINRTTDVGVIVLSPTSPAAAGAVAVKPQGPTR